MTLYEVWKLSPMSHIFVRGERDGKRDVWEYHGGNQHGDRKVVSLRGLSYPNMSSVIEVEVEP